MGDRDKIKMDMEGGGDLLPPLPVNDLLPLMFFDHPLPPFPSLSPSLLLNQPLQNSQQIANSDIEWANILSSSIINGGSELQKPNNNSNNISSVLQLGSLTNEGDNNLNHNQNQNKHKGKSGRSKKYVPPRFAFHTRSTEDILDDGYKWRKYGQKSVKNSKHPRYVSWINILCLYFDSSENFT